LWQREQSLHHCCLLHIHDPLTLLPLPLPLPLPLLRFAV
jgi:hypothetical protein